jgi:ferredoxin
MDAGPKVETGFDLALTELVENGSHLFVLEFGSAAGADLIRDLSTQPATEEQIAAAERVIAQTSGQMGRSLDTDGLKELLQANHNHPRWDEVAERCLTCGNCTNVCPTCFCTSIEDTTDLAGATAERVRRWDSCFTLDFSYTHGVLYPRRQRAEFAALTLPPTYPRENPASRRGTGEFLRDADLYGAFSVKRLF